MIAFTVAGCDALSDPQDSVPWSLVPQTVTIAVGQKQQIGASTRGNSPTWTSDEPGVVSVSTTGLASALSPGRAHVVLRLRGRMDTTLVIVHAPVRAVHMAASSTPLALGGAMGLAYRAIDPAGDEIKDLQGTTIRWISRNADVASVDSSGLIRAMSLGTTEIILTIDGIADSTSVRVTPEAPPGSPVEPIPPTPVKPPTTPKPPPAAPATASVTVTLDSVALATGHTSGAHALAKDSKGNALSGKATIWTSLNPTIANVSTSGVVTAGSAGTAVIQGTIDGVSGTASVIVSALQVVATPSGTTGDLLAEPTFDATQAKMLFDENFDGYTLASLHPPCGSAEPKHAIIDHSWYYCTTFSTNGGPGVDNGVTIVPGHSGNGVQWHYDGIYQETHGVVTTGGSAPPTGQKGTVVQYWARFNADPGYSLTSTDAQGNGNAIVQIKNIMLWNDQNRFQIMTHAHSGDCPIYGPSYTMLGVADQSLVGCTSDQPVGPFFKSFADGQWHRWTVYYQPNSAQGARDGMARLWIDGTLAIRIDKAGCALTPAGGWKKWCDLAELDAIYSGKHGIGVIEWGANRTDGSGIPFTMAIDDFKWWVMK